MLSSSCIDRVEKCIISLFVQGLIVVGLAAEVWTHVEIEAEDYFFPLEPVRFYVQECSFSDS